MPGRFAAALFILSLMTAPAMAAGPLGPPWPEVMSPDGITLRWYPDEVSEAEAHHAADAHCSAIGRSAVFAAVEQDGSAEIGTYRCR